jgi:hypothetical protein
VLELENKDVGKVLEVDLGHRIVEIANAAGIGE